MRLTFGDYPSQSDLPLQEGNGIWCDYIDTLSGTPGSKLDLVTSI